MGWQVKSAVAQQQGLAQSLLPAMGAARTTALSSNLRPLPSNLLSLPSNLAALSSNLPWRTAELVTLFGRVFDMPDQLHQLHQGCRATNSTDGAV